MTVIFGRALHSLKPSVAYLVYGEISAYDPDILMTAAIEIIHDLLSRRPVIRGKAGKISGSQAFRIVCKEHAGNVYLIEFPSEELHISSQEQEALRTPLLGKADGVFYLILVLVQVGHIDLLPAQLESGLYPLQDVQEQEVLGALYQHCHRGGIPHLQVTGIGVRLKALLLHHLKYPASCGLTYIRMIVQHPRDRA